MKRIKSAPANIAEMVNRKKPEKPTASINSKIVLLCIQDQEKQEKQEKQKMSLMPFKIQKNIEKTVNTIMLDYIENKQLVDTNDEGVLLISILYYYICEKTFTKKNLNEFMLFLIQIFIKYLFTHKLHTYYIEHSELIDTKMALLYHSIHL
jgi:hypothetical protein